MADREDRVIDDDEDAPLAQDGEDAMAPEDELPIPSSWGRPITGRPLPTVGAIVRNQRAGHLL